MVVSNLSPAIIHWGADLTLTSKAEIVCEHNLVLASSLVNIFVEVPDCLLFFLAQELGDMSQMFSSPGKNPFISIKC